MARSVRTESMVHGHHVYKTHWRPEINEQLCYEVERDNSFDLYVVAVMKDGGVVGQLPWELARTLIVSTSFKRNTAGCVARSLATGNFPKLV